MAEAILVISNGLNVPPYSTRKATQTLQPITAATQLRRTVNGALTDISTALFRKFTSVITSNDQQVPEFIFPGITVVVDCLAELAYKTSGGGGAIRTVVSGSDHVDGAYTFYRPQLTMKVVTWGIQRDDWGAISAWNLQLEEV